MRLLLLLTKVAAMLALTKVAAMLHLWPLHLWPHKTMTSRFLVTAMLTLPTLPLGHLMPRLLTLMQHWLALNRLIRGQNLTLLLTPPPCSPPTPPRQLALVLIKLIN